MVSTHLEELLRQIPKNVCIVAATKYGTADQIKQLLPFGIHHFGENRTDALLTKMEALKDEPITWHFIGHLQRNKVRDVIDKIEYLHSLDSLQLAKEIEKYRTKPLKCFIEVNIQNEESKNGLAVSDLPDFVREVLKYPKVEVIGLMTMARKEATTEERKKQFAYLATLMKRINTTFHLKMTDLSMGMSDDYQEAISEGATYVRLGRILWEKRT